VVTLVKAKGEQWDFLLKSEDVPPDCTFTDQCFFDLTIGGEAAGRVVFGMYGNVVPKTVANFVALCKGDQTSAAGSALAYKGSAFHRVIPGFMCQVRIPRSAHPCGYGICSHGARWWGLGAVATARTCLEGH